MTSASIPLIPAATAARLLLGAQGLLDDPTRRATVPELQKLIERLGFVQMDSINVVARAHHLTLHSRLDGFEPEQFRKLLEDRRSLFEHWTHDASAIPSKWGPQWKRRFREDAARMRGHAWWAYHFRGTEAEGVIAHVRERIREEGPLMSKDFEHPEKRGPWWGWKPQKAALDYLWRIGELMVLRRESFQKVYELTERALPDLHAASEPDEAAHLEWACATAAERLGVFTPKELAEFWEAIEAPGARAWCETAVTSGRLVRVEVEELGADKPRPAFALADWEARLASLPEAPERLRLLCPFDPILRDRARCLRRFGFDYRFEAFVPEPKRVHGYFVLPILEGERLVGRLDPKLHRDRGLLEVKGLWWEPGVKATKARRRALDEAVARLAEFVGAEEFSLPR
ncbi:MAG TPA: crosslink repair DNA glycosylase YcaQ family protein [Holophagaceae bacterium]|nr:crosslink repair DNA glycosylase YcaQ family protein [Holophagaceae bacterium]